MGRKEVCRLAPQATLCAEQGGMFFSFLFLFFPPFLLGLTVSYGAVLIVSHAKRGNDSRVKLFIFHLCDNFSVIVRQGLVLDPL